MIYFFSNCIATIQEIPELQHDPDQPEDVDSSGIDHASDSARYACLSRPYIKDLPKKQKTRILSVGELNEVTLDDLWEANEKPKKAGRI